MTTKELVQKAFTINQSDNSHIYREYVWIPPGWQFIFDEFYDAITALSGSLIRVQYAKGVLLTEVKSNTLATKWLSDGLAKKSSNVCMVCGARSFRRKAYDGWPSLCWIHIVEYANQLEEE